MWFISAKKCFLKISGTSIRRCKLSSPSSSSALLRLFRSFQILLPHSPLPRWSTLAWMLPAHQPLTLGTSAPPPPSPTPTMRLKKNMMATMVAATMRMRMTSSSCCYSFLFPFWCFDSKGGEVVIFYLSCVIVNNVKF
jgi:hypothetical protein